MIYRKILKKAQLRGNTLELIIAVFGLMVILGGGYAAYKFFKLYTSQDEEQAKGVLKILSAKIDALNEGGKESALVKGPCGEGDKNGECVSGWWYLTGWGVEDEKRPDRCFFESCLCVCKVEQPPYLLQAEGAQLIFNACQERTTGFCEMMKGVKKIDVKSIGKERVYTGATATASAAVTYIEKDAEKDFILFRTNLMPVEIEKKEGERGGEVVIKLA